MEEFPNGQLDLGGNSMVVHIIYRDNEIAFGEVPVTTGLYKRDIRVPMIYTCAAEDTSISYIIGLLGRPPPVKAVPSIKEVLGEMSKLFDQGYAPRKRIKI